jgi:hypothetical protein
VKSDWPLPFAYGILAGVIDSDGHVHEHLGTEVKTVSPPIFKAILDVLSILRISAKTSIVDAPRNSYSKRPRYVIYIPSNEMKNQREKIPSVKIARVQGPGKARKLN